VRYEIQPPVGREEPKHAAAIAWFLHASDDVGGSYQEGGGAFGASPDGNHTEGVRSLQPAPPDDVQRIDLSFFAPGTLEEPIRRLRIVVPPR